MCVGWNKFKFSQRYYKTQWGGKAIVSTINHKITDSLFGGILRICVYEGFGVKVATRCPLWDLFSHLANISPYEEFCDWCEGEEVFALILTVEQSLVEKTLFELWYNSFMIFTRTLYLTNATFFKTCKFTPVYTVHQNMSTENHTTKSAFINWISAIDATMWQCKCHLPSARSGSKEPLNHCEVGGKHCIPFALLYMSTHGAN